MTPVGKRFADRCADADFRLVLKRRSSRDILAESRISPAKAVSIRIQMEYPGAPSEYLLHLITRRLNETLSGDGISSDQADFGRPRRGITHVSLDGLTDVRCIRGVSSAAIRIRTANP